jgi:phosphotransferase system enzyme I (PtsI)
VYRDILLRDQEQYDIEEHEVGDELARIEKAIGAVSDDLSSTAGGVTEKLGAEHGAIFSAQRELLRDATVLKHLTDELRDSLVNAEEVVKRVFRRLAHKLRESDNSVIEERCQDLNDLGRRLIRSLVGIHIHTLENIPHGSIVVAKRLLPSDTAVLSRKSAAGVVVEFGGPASHAAILTREMGVPAISGISDVVQEIEQGIPLLLDGDAAVVVVQPTDAVAESFDARLEQQAQSERKLEAVSRPPAETRDGTRIAVLANVACAEDVALAEQKGADGIGLYRTEGLFLSAKRLPSDDELLQAMRKTLSPMRGKPATVRLVDIGGDKDLPFLPLPDEDNPFLGVRGVRLLLRHPKLARAQLRALARLSGDLDVRVLVPMVTLPEDVVRIREILRAEATVAGLSEPPPLGAMIETPAAALAVSEIAEVSDFLSIGTNDLTQYAMAAGRENPRVSGYFIDDHPVILKLVSLCIEGAGDLDVSLCGELAGRPAMLEPLVRSGLRSLSVAARSVPVIKSRARDIRL